MIVAVVLLGVGTFALRLAGPALRARVEISPRVQRVMMVGVAVLFSALVAVSTFIDGHGFAGYARPAGVLVGGVLAWRKVPFVIVVIAAAGTAAGLRLLGVP
ncbi:AzlD domain-containing protein [Kibdelosporangium philippinense]|uniref:AzlD domain-containing protein n=1 Tax=Kibdelosporangium philippinense TaxID=211113 RepID=A0ABS8Z9P5_9PSEU|nr:AzlD domain-containing protein [Kibdelosporangium philippinense]MCE7002562.1 AzlD domain-containing protein [Kibdelosporangium philippinense]